MSEALDARDVEAPADVDAQHPWLGLPSFTEELQPYFHGRRDESDELLRRVKRKVLTVLFGQSGLGKTSLLRAGLFPVLRSQNSLPVFVRIDYSAEALPPTQQIKVAIIRAAEVAGLSFSEAPQTEELPTGSPGNNNRTLWEFFHRSSSACKLLTAPRLTSCSSSISSRSFFTLGGSDSQSRTRNAPFLTELAELIENRVPNDLQQRFGEDSDLVEQFSFEREDYRVLLCLREDYLPNLEDLRQHVPSISENRMRLTRMTGVQALEAVSKPGGELLLPSVSRQIVRFVAGAPYLGANGAEDDEGYDLGELEIEPAPAESVLPRVKQPPPDEGTTKNHGGPVSRQPRAYLARLLRTLRRRPGTTSAGLS
jgi:hypothetical protein